MGQSSILKAHFQDVDSFRQNCHNILIFYCILKCCAFLAILFQQRQTGNFFGDPTISPTIQQNIYQVRNLLRRAGAAALMELHTSNSLRTGAPPDPPHYDVPISLYPSSASHPAKVI